DHSSEEVLIFSRQALGVERLRITHKQFVFQEHIASAALAPGEDLTGEMSGPIIESTFDKPLWRTFLEIRLHWPKHAIHFVVVDSYEKIPQPFADRDFVIIHESDEITFCILQRRIARQGNVLDRLQAVLHRNNGLSCNLTNNRACA